MPLVRISMLSGRTKSEKQRISDSIHESLVESFKIPDTDYNHRINEYEEEDFIRPSSQSKKYILIEMTIFPGRSEEAKEKLYNGIVFRLKEAGIPKQDITIVLNEPPLENWGIAGGQSGKKANIGFELKV